MQNNLVELQRKMATMDGVPVLQVMRMKTAGNEAQMEKSATGDGEGLRAEWKK